MSVREGVVIGGAALGMVAGRGVASATCRDTRLRCPARCAVLRDMGGDPVPWGGEQVRGQDRRDNQTGEGIVVTLWDSEEAARTAVERNGATMAKLGPLTVTGQTPVPPRAYEVLLHSEG